MRLHTYMDSVVRFDGITSKGVHGMMIDERGVDGWW